MVETWSALTGCAMQYGVIVCSKTEKYDPMLSS